MAARAVGAVTVDDTPPGPIAVLDSSVLVPVWSRLVLQRLAAEPTPKYRPVWSEWIIAGTWRVLTWRWVAQHGRGDEEALARAANRMLRRLLGVMHVVSIREAVGPPPWPELRDEDDTPVWATAVAARAQYVVSHNTADFPPLEQGRHVYQGVEYLTAIEFVEGVLDVEAEQILGAALPRGGAVRSRRTATAT